jgi:hypothetical protein
VSKASDEERELIGDRLGAFEEIFPDDHHVIVLVAHPGGIRLITRCDPDDAFNIIVEAANEGLPKHMRERKN